MFIICLFISKYYIFIHVILVYNIMPCWQHYICRICMFPRMGVVWVTSDVLGHLGKNHGHGRTTHCCTVEEVLLYKATKVPRCVSFTQSTYIIPIYRLGSTSFYYITFAIETIININIFSCCYYKLYIASQWGQLNIYYGWSHLMVCYEYGHN